MPLVILGLTFCLTGGLWCVSIAFFSSIATKRLRKSAKIELILNKLTGLVFIAMGLKLFKTKAA
jgi:threonine/homoserine/homoserine lactone efflux protein